MAAKTKSSDTGGYTDAGGQTHAERSHSRPSSPPVAAHELGEATPSGFQQAAGNLAVQRLLRSGRAQAKLTVNKPGDVYEQEADRVAAHAVLRMSAHRGPPAIQRLCTGCEEDVQRQAGRNDEDLVQARKPEGGTSEAPSWLTSRIEEIKGRGAPLPASERRFFEPRFGLGFGNVRLHTDSRAAEAARAVNARAFTVGRDVVFAAGQYTPGNLEGRKLLAHELTHTVQQAGSVPETTSSPPAHVSGSDKRRPAIRTAATRRRVARQSNVCNKKPTFPEKILCEIAARRKHESVEKWIGALRALIKMVPASEAKKVHLRLSSDKDALGIFFQRELHPYPAERDALLNILRKHFSTAAAPRGVTPGAGAAAKTQPAKLNFYHGTRWSIAQKIPKNVKAIGGGDFAAGFYTHQDADDVKALGRAKTWAIRVANQNPKEPNAGVVVFKVPTVDYQNLLSSNAKVFDLTQKDQKDYAQKQKEWIEFVTSYGREEQPTFRPDRKEWAHEPRDPQPQLGYDVVQGPFYRPIKGTATRKPKPSEFHPFAEGMALPHQVTWANKGVDLLNSPNVNTELRKYDAKSGDPVPVPHATSGSPPSRAPSIGPAPEPAKPRVFCRGGEIGCATWDYMQAQFYLSEDQARTAIDMEHKLLLKHRPPAPPRTSFHGEAPGMKRHRLLREEARRRVLKVAGLEGLIGSKYAR